MPLFTPPNPASRSITLSTLWPSLLPVKPSGPEASSYLPLLHLDAGTQLPEHLLSRVLSHCI